MTSVALMPLQFYLNVDYIQVVSAWLMTQINLFTRIFFLQIIK